MMLLRKRKHSQGLEDLSSAGVREEQTLHGWAASGSATGWTWECFKTLVMLKAPCFSLRNKGKKFQVICARYCKAVSGFVDCKLFY
jgi:hypothetical protein